MTLKTFSALTPSAAASSSRSLFSLFICAMAPGVRDGLACRRLEARYHDLLAETR